MKHPSLHAALLLLALAWCAPTLAQEDVIRRNLAERLPLMKGIDEVTKSPIDGLYEVRVGHDIYYTDRQGDYLIQGRVIDARTRTDLTQARIDVVTAFDFSALPLKDAIVWRQGSGARKLVVFADPNCEFCRRFEKDLLQVDNLSIYTFLYPILGGDSPDKARDIWCAKNPAKTWREWMLDGKTPPRHLAPCDTSALARIAALGRQHRVTGTPTLVFESGIRVSGALPAAEVEKHLAQAASARSRPGPGR
jgi:thiol:disulfide interchange protein DsbC